MSKKKSGCSFFGALFLTSSVVGVGAGVVAAAIDQPLLCVSKGQTGSVVNWKNDCPKPINFALYDRSLIIKPDRMAMPQSLSIQFGSAESRAKIASVTKDIYSRTFISACYAPKKPELVDNRFTCK